MAQYKPTSKSQKVRNMLAKGHDVSYIARTLGVKPQMVYNIRWRMNKKAGLGAIVVPPTVPEQTVVDTQSTDSPAPRKAKIQERPFVNRVFARVVAFFRGW